MTFQVYNWHKHSLMINAFFLSEILAKSYQNPHFLFQIPKDNISAPERKRKLPYLNVYKLPLKTEHNLLTLSLTTY